MVEPWTNSETTRGNAPEPTQQEVLEYITSLAEGLQRFALRAKLPFLAYLLDLAREEANGDMSTQSTNGARALEE